MSHYLPVLQAYVLAHVGVVCLMHVCMHLYTRVCVHLRVFVRTRTFIRYANAGVHGYRYICNSYIYICKGVCLRVCTHARTHTRTHARSVACARTHTQMHKNMRRRGGQTRGKLVALKGLLRHTCFPSIPSNLFTIMEQTDPETSHQKIKSLEGKLEFLADKFSGSRGDHRTPPLPLSPLPETFPSPTRPPSFPLYSSSPPDTLMHIDFFS